MTDQEKREDPGWVRIQDIKKGREIPYWDDQKKDFTRAWTDEDFDMTKEFVLALETELIDHDEVKCRLRRERGWPVTDWDDDWYLDKHWPEKDKWLHMIRIWKRALWSRFLGVMSIDLKEFTVGVTDRVPYKQRFKKVPKSSGVDRDLVAWIFEAALVKAAHGHDLMKEGIVWTSCKVHHVGISSDGKTATINAMVVFIFPTTCLTLPPGRGRIGSEEHYVT